MTAISTKKTDPTLCDCLLTALAGPSLRGPLVGLNLTQGELYVDKAVFACCQGEGVREVAVRELAACSLKQRLLDVNFLWYRLTQAVGPIKAQELLTSLTPDLELRLLQRLQKLSLGTLTRGVVLPAGHSDRASLVWYVALVATWRYGIRCHVIDWHVGSQPQWAPEARFWQGQRRMILVADVDQLWDPVRVFDLEWLIGLAYQSEIPFWLGYAAEKAEVVPPRPGDGQAKEGAGKPSVRSKAFGDLLKKARNRAPVDWLSKDMRSKLEELCEVRQVKRAALLPTHRAPGAKAPSVKERNPEQ